MQEEILRKFTNERQECEIWCRVMGYYRPVSEFNIGKRGEFNERVNFALPSAQILS